MQMMVKFDVHGTKVGIMTNNHIGKGVVEFEVAQSTNGFRSSTMDPSAAELVSGDASGPAQSMTLILSKSETRAIASALMGAAAEL
jgi:hypothetical protein